MEKEGDGAAEADGAADTADTDGASTLNTENSPMVTPYTGKKLSTVIVGSRRMLL